MLQPFPLGGKPGWVPLHAHTSRPASPEEALAP